ncbi:MAG: hypothetical protein JJT78_15375 [Leptospira sp.]|nr:hypothetical protein [Leptospira sp.]
MRKIVLLFIFSIFSISCLKFEESDLDPNSPFSQLLLLSRLAALRGATVYEVPFSVRDSASGNFLGPLSAARLTKVDEDYVLPDFQSFDDTLSDGQNRGVFFYEYGAYTVRFRELGGYRVDFYNLSGGGYGGSIHFQVDSESQELPTILGDTIVDDLVWEKFPIRMTNSNSPIVRLSLNSTSQFARLMDSNNQRSFIMGEYIFNELSFMDSNGTDINNYLILHFTDDGKNINSIPIYEIPIKTIIGSIEEKAEISNSITINENLYAIINRVNNFDGTVNYSALIRIPINNPKNYELTPLNPRGSGNQHIEADTIGFFAGNIYYEELDGDGNIQMRFEPGIFEDPVSSAPVNISGTQNPFGLAGRLTFLQFTENYILYQDEVTLSQNIYSYDTNGEIPASPVAILASPCSGMLGSPIQTYRINQSRSFFLRRTDSSLSYCINTSSIPFTTTESNYTFSTDFELNLTKSVTSDTLAIQEKSNATDSFLQLKINSGNSEIHRFFRYPHSNVPAIEFTINNEAYRPLIGFTEAPPDFDGLSVLGDKVITYKSPRYRDNSLESPDQLLYEIGVSASTNNGEAWSEWRAIDINIAPPPL